MIDTKESLLIALILYIGLTSIALAEVTEQALKEKPSSTWELIKKSQLKEPESAKSVSVGRVLHFPKERSLGRLMIGDENPTNRPRPFGYPFEGIRWQRYSPAQGDVRIPHGKIVQLILDFWTWQNPQALSVLKQLQPDEIYSLTLSPKWSIGGRNPGDQCMPYIAHLSGLKTLNLDGADITSQGLKYLIAFKSLERLKPPAGLNDSGMALIGKLRPLKVLYIGEKNYVTNNGLRQLSNLKSLELLVINSIRMTDEGLNVFSELPVLNHLILDGQFTNDAILYLKDIDSLRTLTVGIGGMSQVDRRPILMQRFNDRGMKNVSNLTQLENFIPHWVEGITDKGVANLKDMPNLKCLDIGHAKLTDKAMLDLKQIRTLEHLHLPHFGFTDECFKHVVELQNLKYLWGGSRSELTNESLRYISQLKNLEELCIGSAGFSDEGMKHIAKMTNLKRLSLFRADGLTNDGLTDLGALESLTNFHLGDGTRISISGLKSLNRLKNLTNLNLDAIHQDNSSFMDLSDLTKLERLSINLHRVRKDGTMEFMHNSFRDEDWACLANLTELKTLQITGVGISDKGIKHLSNLKNLEFLNIVCRGEEKITDNALKHLANLYKLNRLQILDGHFTDKALDYLDGMSSLTWLELTSDYAFSNQAIRDFQQKNPNITKLQLIP